MEDLKNTLTESESVKKPEEDGRNNIEDENEVILEERESEAVNQTYYDEEDSDEIIFLKGNRGAKNPGKLIIGNKQQFICNRPVKKGERTRYWWPSTLLAR